jgi:asparagine synthase (glutamine-hydrolysing)
MVGGRETKIYLNRKPEEGESRVAIALAHRRLAILDRSDAGLQPMRSEDGRLYLIFNGEIYNYRELRHELQSRGFRFSTGTDSEVVLAAFACWGTSAFARFNGMWAMGIYDALELTLTVSRDRLGVKPLYFSADANSVSFASEIKALIVGKSRSCRSRAMERFLRLGIVGNDNTTFFQGVDQFPPGCYAKIKLSDRQVHPVPYWSPSSTECLKWMKPKQVTEELRGLFEDSVNLRLHSDVPVGFCLSGGLDSSSIVGVARKLLHGSKLSTFHARSDDPRFDESEWASMVNKHVSATPYFATPSVRVLLDDLDRLVWHQDEPFPTLSIFAQWLLMKKSHLEGVPVLLDGQGGDELFAGYRKYLFVYLRSLVRNRKYATAASTVRGFVVNGDRGVLNLVDGLKYMPRLLRQTSTSLENFMLPSVAEGVGDAALARIVVPSDIRKMSVLDLTSTSLPSLLRYEDRNSMAWSIEAREPFLDFRLVEFALGIPDELKISNGRLKAVLREAMRPYLPQKIVDRRDKVGFVMAELGWLDSELMPPVIESLEAKRERLAEWVDVERLLRRVRGDNHLPVALKRGLIRLFIAARWLNTFGG